MSRMSIRGAGIWVATSDNFLRSGALGLRLHPSSESLAGSAVSLCALLTSADEGLPERYNGPLPLFFTNAADAVPCEFAPETVLSSGIKSC